MTVSNALSVIPFIFCGMYDEHISSSSSAIFFASSGNSCTECHTKKERKIYVFYTAFYQLPHSIIKLLFKYHNKPTKDFITT